MKKNPVNWFEIPVDDLDRARKFYESVFDVELNLLEMGPMKMFQFPMVDGIYGTGGTLVKAAGSRPSQEGTLVYFSVGDIDGTLKKIIAGGGEIILPKMSIGEYGVVARFEDSEGNRVALHTMA